MAETKRTNRRAALALVAIVALCAVAIFIFVAILFVRINSPLNRPPVGVPVNVGGQRVTIYPVPDMSVRIVSGQSSGVSTGEAVGDQIGTGGQGSGSLSAPASEAPRQAATLPPPPPSPTPRPPTVILMNHLVVPGDTLYRLTQTYNTSIDLMASYNIAANTLIAGNTISLPVANPNYCPASRPHVVRDQQTVSEIARQYATTPQAIATANGLDANYSVKTSQVICVP